MADFTKNANATLDLVQLLISGTTSRPKLLASDAFSNDNAIGTASRIRRDIGSFPPAWATSAVSRLKARSATRPTRVSSAAARQHH
jgi:hypothetical protein